MARLNIFRRHITDPASDKFCPQGKAKGRDFWGCMCPIQGEIPGRDGKRFMLPKHIQTKPQAIAYADQWTKENAEPDSAGNVMIGHAIAAFQVYLKNTVTRKPETIRKYRALLRDVQVAANNEGLTLVKQLGSRFWFDFYSAWVKRDKKGVVMLTKTGDTVCLNPDTRRVRLERVRTFCLWLVTKRWLNTNPIDGIEPPECPAPDVAPYEPAEFEAILSAIEHLIKTARHPAAFAAWQRVLTLTLLMRYTGMAIGDALLAGPDNLQSSGEIVYRRRKTIRFRNASEIKIPIPPSLITRLNETAPKGPSSWFWTGNGNVDTVVKDMHEMYQRVYELAKITGGHAHRFRHTFAVEMLKAGVHVKVVARLMGHSSALTTERYYAKYTNSWQAEANEAVRLAWARDNSLSANDLHHVGAVRVQRGRKVGQKNRCSNPR